MLINRNILPRKSMCEVCIHDTKCFRWRHSLKIMPSLAFKCKFYLALLHYFVEEGSRCGGANWPQMCSFSYLIYISIRFCGFSQSLCQHKKGVSIPQYRKVVISVIADIYPRVFELKYIWQATGVISYGSSESCIARFIGINQVLSGCIWRCTAIITSGNIQ